MFSHTQFGLSFIILTFDDQVNDYFARQQVLERLQRRRPAARRAAAAGAALDADRRDLPLPRSRGDRVELDELRTLQDWVVERSCG